MIVGSKWGKDLKISVHKELWCFQILHVWKDAHVEALLLKQLLHIRKMEK